MKDTKRYAWVVKETGRVASIRIGEPHLPADRKATMEIVEVGVEVESGMWRQKNGKYTKEREAKAVKSDEQPIPMDYVHPSLAKTTPPRSGTRKHK